MSRIPPETVGKLQRVLHEKAKASPKYRFYALYDKVYRKDVLAYAYERCRRNKGAAGVDRQTFDDIEEYGRERWLGELAEERKTVAYRPAAVRRVWIPKSDGQLRPLGIPTIRDRVVPMAFGLVVEPIFDGDLQPEQHAYRANRSAHDAVRGGRYWLDRGYPEIVDADVSGYFDSIPHHERMKGVARRIRDGRVLHLVKMWLETAVEEMDETGNATRTTRNKDEGCGTPQGGVASPLLANSYMRRFVLGWKTGGHEKRLDAHIANYADDFVICCKWGVAGQAMIQMRAMEEELKLTVNEKKTRQCSVPSETFAFLGFTFGRHVSWVSGQAYIAPAPARKKILGVCDKISEETSRRTVSRSEADEVNRFNPILMGWGN